MAKRTNGLDLCWIRWNSILWENNSKKWNLVCSEHTLLPLRISPLSDSLYWDFFNCCVMLFSIFSKDHNITRYVSSSEYVLYHVSDGLWKISEAVSIPKLRRLYLEIPKCVLKAVIYLESGCNSSWWYPLGRSSLLDTLGPFKSNMSSSILGIVWRWRFTALFASLMTTHSLISSLSSTAEIQGVGCLSTFSMMSVSTRCWIPFATSLCKWNGVSEPLDVNIH